MVNSDEKEGVIARRAELDATGSGLRRDIRPCESGQDAQESLHHMRGHHQEVLSETQGYSN